MAALTRQFERSFVGRCVQRFFDIQGIDRALVIASQAFTALIPILILTSSYTQTDDSSMVADAMIRRLHLTGDTADAVHTLFAIPPSSTAGFSVFSLLLLVYSGVSFTRRMQRMYVAAYERQRPGARGNVFAFLGLILLLLEIVVVAAIRALVRRLPLDWLLMFPLSFAAGVVLWTFIPWLLLNREVHWRRLLATGAVAAACTSVFGVLSTLYMPRLLEQSINQYGMLGITFSILGWLLAIAVIVVATAVVGGEFDRTRDEWALRLKRRFGLVDPGQPEALEPYSVQERPPIPRDEDIFENPFIIGRLLLDWLIVAGAFWVCASIVPSIHVTGGFFTYVWLSVLFGLVNAVLGPVLHFVAWPLTALTLGLFALVVNAVLLGFTALLSPQLQIGTVVGAIFGALIIAMVTSVLNFVFSPIKKQAS